MPRRLPASSDRFYIPRPMTTNIVDKSPPTKKKKIDLEPKRDFSSPWHFSDVVLVVQDRKFHVHKSTLSMWSPVFETMFTSEFKEKTSPEIPLPGKTASEIEALLQLIYSRKEQVSEKNFEILLKLADEYQMKEVSDLCLNFMNSILKRETSLHLYDIAVKYNLQDFLKKCLDIIVFLPHAHITKSKHFLELEVKDQFNIINCKAKATEDALAHNRTRVDLKEKLDSIIDQSKTLKSCGKCYSDDLSAALCLSSEESESD